MNSLISIEDKKVDYPKSTPGVGLVNGKFVDEDAVSGTPGSLISAVWGNAVTDELLAVIRAAQIEPKEQDPDQLLEAIRFIIQNDAYAKERVYNKEEVDTLLKRATALPIGVIVPFPTAAVPAGFLEVDGSLQSIAVYPDLAAFLGTKFNVAGDPAGYFRLPESRGEFLRGWDHGRGIDTGRGIGTWQADDNKSHVHTYTRTPLFGNASGGQPFAVGVDNGTTTVSNRSDGFNSSGGAEARPRNVAVMWCIKAWSVPVNQGAIDVNALAQSIKDNFYGRFLRLVTFTSSGTYVPSPQMKLVRVRMVGAGGASGGTQATSSTQYALSSGGGAGSYSESLLTAAQIGASQVVTIGAAGAVGAPATAGGNGGATSLGSLVSTPGGSGSAIGIPFPAGVGGINSGATGGSLPSGANIIARRGGDGGMLLSTPSGTLSGYGGSSEFGVGGSVSGLSTPGNTGSGPGAGASGIASRESIAARVGIPGTPGMMILEEFA
ncbi:phage tail protein [Pseudomonas alliivorans]|nr:phage tail protein [Pseudomonas alliivorans]